jgi:hypothetical protein
MKDTKITKSTGRKWTLAVLALFATPVLFLSAGGIDDDASGSMARNRYIGAARCKSCHRAEDTGNQYGVWVEKRHSHAYETLASDSAKKYAQERGVTDPQKSDQCMKCHETAFGVAKREIHRSFKPNLGVQCESCHGPGETHMKARMKAAAVADPGAGYTTIPKDEINVNPQMDTCLGCHNEESPGFKPFCFYDFVQGIRHLNPLKPRTEQELAALLVCGCGEKCVCVNGCADGACGVPPKAGK